MWKLKFFIFHRILIWQLLFDWLLNYLKQQFFADNIPLSRWLSYFPQIVFSLQLVIRIPPLLTNYHLIYMINITHFTPNLYHLTSILWCEWWTYPIGIILKLILRWKNIIRNECLRYNLERLLWINTLYLYKFPLFSLYLLP